MKRDCYEIVKDKAALENFVNWLPDLEQDEYFYVCLFARKKYCKHLIKSNDKTQLKRFITKKEWLIDKIYKLEIPVGYYKLKDVIAPQESLALYISPNPKSMINATSELIKKSVDLIRNNNGFNIISEATSMVHKSKSRTVVVDFDIDGDKEEIKKTLIPKLESIFPSDVVEIDGKICGVYRILETRGGFHIIVNSKNAKQMFLHYGESPNNWYKAIHNNFEVDMSNDILLPVAGCTQGGFTPKMWPLRDITQFDLM